MKRPGMILLCLLMPFVFQNCASLRGAPEEHQYKKEYVESILEYYKNRDIYDEYLYTHSIKDGTKTTRFAADQLKFRNKIIHDFKAIINYEYRKFTTLINQESNKLNLSLDSALLVFSGLGTAGTLNEPISSAITSGLLGVRTAVNDKVLLKKTIPALIAQMEALRAEVNSEITLKLNQSVTEYPLTAALDDLDRLYYAGTLFAALSGIQKDSKEKENNAQEVAFKKVAGELTYSFEGIDSEILEYRNKLIGELTKQISQLSDKKAINLVKKLPKLFSQEQVNEYNSSFGADITTIQNGTDAKESLNIFMRVNLPNIRDLEKLKNEMNKS